VAKNPEKSKGPCPTKGCTGEIAFKGVCRSCWGQAKTLIDAGETTWEELERMGLVTLGDKPFRNLFFQLKNGPQPDEKGQPEKEPSTVPFPNPPGGYGVASSNPDLAHLRLD
jgi:hypothetical protein